MARRTRRENDQYVRTYYGINRKTFAVESVSETRGGMLHKFGKDMRLHTTPIGHGRPAEAEIVIVYGLTDLYCVTVGFEDTEMTKRQIERLEAKAAEVKKAAENKTVAGEQSDAT